MSSISGSESESEDSDSDGGEKCSCPTDNESSANTGLITGRLFSKVFFQNSSGQYLSVYRCILQGKVSLPNSKVCTVYIMLLIFCSLCSCNFSVRWWTRCSILLNVYRQEDYVDCTHDRWRPLCWCCISGVSGQFLLFAFTDFRLHVRDTRFNEVRQPAQGCVSDLPNTLYICHRKEVLQHKTFHRYTVRAKRGTAQGVRDSQNRSNTPKSAGAALRRHNEAALVKARLLSV